MRSKDTIHAIRRGHLIINIETERIYNIDTGRTSRRTPTTARILATLAPGQHPIQRDEIMRRITVAVGQPPKASSVSVTLYNLQARDIVEQGNKGGWVLKKRYG